MIGLIIIGFVFLVYYGKIKHNKPTNEAANEAAIIGRNKGLMLYAIHTGTALGLGFMLPVMALFSVPDLLLLLILFIAILSEFINIYFYAVSKE